MPPLPDGRGYKAVFSVLKVIKGMCLICVCHCADNWKNLTPFQSTPSIVTEKNQRFDFQEIVSTSILIETMKWVTTSTSLVTGASLLAWAFLDAQKSSKNKMKNLLEDGFGFSKYISIC